ncbi:MAG TPA: glycosyltransferase family 2 protein [Gemmataceae bacterium]|nr:glycosyltransferase family 2 protein [Gemmataceae bacterium]
MSNTVAPAPAAPRPRHRAARARPATGIPDVSVCIANWNCRYYLRDCLESLLDDPQGVTVEVIVVDNASADGAADMVAREFPEVILVRNDQNHGFAKASNQAAALANGRYVFFLNNDTIVPPLALSRLVAFADAHPQAGMIGPRLRDGEGRLQISYRRKPALKAMLHRAALLRWTGLFRRAYDEYRRDGFEPEGVRRVDVLMGAAVLMPRTVYRECGGWDEGFRFGVEDVELSDRVGRDRALVHVPGVEIVHFGRVSSRQNVTFAAPNLMIGYVRYFRKSGVSRLGLLGYKLVFTLDAPLQLAGKSAQYLWRRLTKAEPAKAEKSRLALCGGWRFLTRELGRFWRA